MSNITVIEITGIVRKTVAIGLKKVAKFFLNPAITPRRKPEIDATSKPTNNLIIVWNIEDNESISAKILKKADNTSSNLGKSSGLSTITPAITHTRNKKNTDSIVNPVFFKYIT